MLHAGIKVHMKKILWTSLPLLKCPCIFFEVFFLKLKTSFLAWKKLNIHMLKAAAYIGQNNLITTLNI